MSEQMATRMCEKTGISPEWLLAGDAKATPVSARGEKYTKAAFEKIQAGEETGGTRQNRPPSPELMLDALDLCARLVAILASARANDDYSLAYYKAVKSVLALREEFGHDATLYPPSKQTAMPLIYNTDKAEALISRVIKSATGLRDRTLRKSPRKGD